MIVVAGEALIDLVITPAGEVSAALGGAPFNTARACSRWGGHVTFVGALSRDRFGERLARQLTADGVDITHAPRVELPTTLAAAELDDDGAATYRFYVDGTSAPALLPAADLAGTSLRADALFTGGLGLVLEPMAATIESMLASRRGTAAPALMVDVNCRPRLIADHDGYVRRVRAILAEATVVKVSADDLAYLEPRLEPRAAARRIVAGGAGAVLLTDGAGELHVLTAAGERTVAVPPVEVVDTIGAGDTFCGAFLAEWEPAADPTPDQLLPAVTSAITAAGLACQRAGADPPWR